MTIALQIIRTEKLRKRTRANTKRVNQVEAGEPSKKLKMGNRWRTELSLVQGRAFASMNEKCLH